MKTQERKKVRMEIAISLLRGKLVEKLRDGYDPMGTYRYSINNLTQSALDMAEVLITKNECYDGHDWETNTVDEIIFCRRCGVEGGN